MGKREAMVCISNPSPSPSVSCQRNLATTAQRNHFISLPSLVSSLCKQELQRLYAEAAALPQPEKPPHRHDTEQRTQYIPIDLTGMK
jgi:hypothetical protein